MNSISTEIISHLNTKSYTYPTTIVRAFNENTKTFPVVLIQQQEDMTFIRTAAGEKVSEISFIVSVFAKDYTVPATQSVQEHIDDKIKVCETIASEIDSFIQDEYGLRRIGANEIYAYANTIAAKNLFYNGYIIDGYIYGSMPY